MLRKIDSDIGAKYYTQRARELTFYHAGVKDEICSAITKKNPKLSSSIRSVVQTGNTATVRVASRAAMSELHIYRETIKNIIQEKTGAEILRITL